MSSFIVDFNILRLRYEGSVRVEVGYMLWTYKHKKGVPEGTPFLYRTIGSERPRSNHKNYFSAKYALMSASSRMF